jgi:hypothetical protein
MMENRLWDFALSCCAILSSVAGADSAASTLSRFRAEHFSFLDDHRPGHDKCRNHVGLQPLHGFSGDVRLTLSGLPDGGP